MTSLKEIGKSALTTGLEVLQDVAKGENFKTVAKKRLKETIQPYCFHDGTQKIYKR